MNLRVLSRTLAVSATGAVITAVLPVAAANAAPTATVTAYSGAHSAPDNQSVPLTIRLSGLTAPYVNPVVTFLDASVYQSQAQATGTAGTFDPSTGTQTVTANVNFADPADGSIPAAPGVATIEVCESDCIHVMSPINKTTGTLLLTASAPTISSIAPTSMGANGVKTVTLHGGNIARGATFSLKQDGGSTVIQPSAVTVASGSISGTVDLTKAGQPVNSSTDGGDPVGAYTPTITNLDGQSGAGASLELTAPPTVASLSVPDLGQNASNFPLTVAGGNFDDPTIVVTHAGGTSDFTVAVDSATTTATAIHATFSGTATSTGSADLKVLNADGGYFVYSTVVGAPPTVTTVTPSALGQGASGASTTVTGTGFLGTANAVPTVDYGAGVTHDAVPAFTGTATTLTVPNVSVSATAPTGSRAITVVNPDGAIGTSGASALTIDAAPEITGISPTQLARNTGNQDVTLTGTGFQSGMTVTLQAAGVTPTTLTATTASATSATVTVDTAAMGPGLYSLTPQNTDGGVGAAFSSLNIESFILGTVTPGGVNNGGTQATSVSVTASNGSFPTSSAGYTLTLTPDPAIANQDPITSSVGTINSNTWSGSIDLTHASPGTYDVSISDGTNSGGCSCQFTVGQANAPTITSNGVSPNAIAQGATQQTVTISGTGFVSGDDIVLQRTSGSPATTAPVDGLSTSNVVVSGSGTDGLGRALTFTLTATSGVTTGAVDVVVKESGGGPSSNVCTGCLTVDPPPTVTSLDKTSVGQRATGYHVVVSGSNLPTSSSTGSYVFSTSSGSDSGVSVTNVAGTASSVTLTLDVSTSSALGAHTLTVTNTADQGVAQLADAITVDVPPSPTSLQPAAVAPGASSVPVAISGSDFTGPVTVTSPEATFTNPTVNGTTVNVTAAIAPSAVDGTTYPVTVTNADGGSGSCSCLFVAQAPSWSSQALSVGEQDGALAVSWPAADNGGAAISSYTATLTPPANSNEDQQVQSVPVDNTGGGHTTFTGLVNGESYTVAVTATNIAGTSSALTGTGTPHTVPSAPASVSATPGDGSLAVSWTAPTSDGGSALTSYSVTVTPHASGTPVASKTTDASTLSHTFTGLTNGTVYDVSVSASNIAGNGPAATTTGTPRTVPSAPASVSATPGDGSLAVSWTAPTSDGGSAVSSYTATVTPHAGGTAVTFSTTDASTLSHTFTGLTNGTLYDVSVVATNAAGNGPAATTTGTPRAVPGAPTGVSATPGDAQATVAWSAPSNGGAAITGYVVTVSPGGTTVTAPASSTSAVVVGLRNGTAYSFTVAATNAAGTGAPSAAATATPRFATALTIAHSAGHIVYGHTLTLSGLLTRSDGSPLAGASVVIYRQLDSGAIGKIATVTTGSAGRWRLSIRPGHDARYSAVFFGDSADTAQGSAKLRTTVASLVKITHPAAGSTSSTGTPLVVTGYVGPNKHGRTVRLYYVDSHGRLHLLKSAVLSRRSTYRFAVGLRRGTWRLEVRIGATSGNTAGRSAVLKVTRA